MSFEDYVNYIKQKYKLIIAISVLKTKPENISVEKYIDYIRYNMDNDESFDSVYTDDFALDDDDETVNNTQNNCNDTQKNANDTQMFTDSDQIIVDAQCFPSLEPYDNVNIDVIKTRESNIQKYANHSRTYKQIGMFEENDCTKVITKRKKKAVKYLNDKNRKFDIIMKIYNNNLEKCDKHGNNIKVHDNDAQINDVRPQEPKSDTQVSNDSINLLQDYIQNIDYKKHSLEIFEILREADDKTTSPIRDTQIFNNTDKTFCESQFDVGMELVIPPTITNNDGSKTNKIDSQQTEIYSVQGFSQNYTSISQSQTQHVDISPKYIYGNKNNNSARKETKVNDNFIITENKTVIDEEDIFTQSQHYNENTHHVNNSHYNITTPENDINNAMESSCKIERANNNFSETENLNAIDNINDCEMKETDCKQNENYIEINGEVNSKALKSNPALDYQTNISQKEVEDKPQNVRKQQDTNINLNFYQSNDNSINKYDAKKIIHQDIMLLHSQDLTNENYYLDAFNTSQVFIQNENNIANLNKQNVNNIDNVNKNYNIKIKNDENEENMETEDKTMEIVPFKIIEELKMINGYLNLKSEFIQHKGKGYLTDSGYRSDTQGRYNSDISSQLSASRLNQSAHCLLNYLTCCPLLPQTKEITTKISMALGDLIDKLHKENNYPSFLEELLDKVSVLLKSLHEDDEGEDSLFNKEELYQRLIFLNRSSHIQKFTIDKIANILEETHVKLTEKDTKQETVNINLLENICYIFHLLQSILPIFLKNCENFSQSSQEEEDDTIKISCLTQVWRRKWDTNLEVKKFEHSVDYNNEVLIKCSEILNKLIIDCIEEYSLIAYYALKCFNLLQS